MKRRMAAVYWLRWAKVWLQLPVLTLLLGCEPGPLPGKVPVPRSAAAEGRGAQDQKSRTIGPDPHEGAQVESDGTGSEDPPFGSSYPDDSVPAAATRPSSCQELGNSGPVPAPVGESYLLWVYGRQTATKGGLFLPAAFALVDEKGEVRWCTPVPSLSAAFAREAGELEQEWRDPVLHARDREVHLESRVVLHGPELLVFDSESGKLVVQREAPAGSCWADRMSSAITVGGRTCVIEGQARWTALCSGYLIHSNLGALQLFEAESGRLVAESKDMNAQWDEVAKVSCTQTLGPARVVSEGFIFLR